MQKTKTIVAVAVATLVIAGCGNDESERLAEMAERNLERQAAQQARNAELQSHVAEGTKRLVESDSAARKTIVQLHRDVQSERFALGQQRDSLEAERREIAATRNRDPIISESIKAVGLVVACLVPLLIAFQILRRSDEPDENAAVTELLLSDLTSASPRILHIHDQSATDARHVTPRLTNNTAKDIERS
jgi:hypothetical protein